MLLQWNIAEIQITEHLHKSHLFHLFYFILILYKLLFRARSSIHGVIGWHTNQSSTCLFCKFLKETINICIPLHYMSENHFKNMNQTDGQQHLSLRMLSFLILYWGSQPQVPWIHLTLWVPTLLRGKTMAEMGRIREREEEIAGEQESEWGRVLEYKVTIIKEEIRGDE